MSETELQYNNDHMDSFSKDAQDTVHCKERFLKHFKDTMGKYLWVLVERAKTR